MEDIFHRYDDWTTAASLDEWDNPIGVPSHKLVHTTYRVVKRTPKGAWIDLGFGSRRFVLLTARKRYALPTQGEALESFILRKQKQEGIYQGRVAKARRAQKMAYAEIRKLKIPMPTGVGLPGEEEALQRDIDNDGCSI